MLSVRLQADRELKETFVNAVPVLTDKHDPESRVCVSLHHKALRAARESTPGGAAISEGV